MGKKNGDRKARLKKQTIRMLDRPSLSHDDLAKVAGAKQPYTVICLTWC